MQIVNVRYEYMERNLAGSGVCIESDNGQDIPRHLVDWDTELAYALRYDAPRGAVIIHRVADPMHGLLASADIIHDEANEWLRVSLISVGNY